jgi:hypothetical protein
MNTTLINIKYVCALRIHIKGERLKKKKIIIILFKKEECEDKYINGYSDESGTFVLELIG